MYHKKIKRKLVLKHISDILPKSCLTFVLSQIREVSKKARGRRWNEHDIQVALSLFHASPKAYRLLKTVFLLPSISTLRKTMQKVSIYPGISDRIIEALQGMVAAMPLNSNICALIFDEIQLKEEVVYNKERDEVEGLEDFGKGQKTVNVANHATVFVVRGLVTKWKQPIGYFLSCGPIKSS